MANLNNNIGFKRKHKSVSVMDKLKSPNIRVVVEAVKTIVQKIHKGDRNEVQFSPERVLRALVRGLGSSNIQVQKNYFCALVALLKSVKNPPEFSIKNILDIVESDLHVTGNIGKGEEGEILMGKVLVFGTLVRSGTLVTAAEEEQVTLVKQLLQDIHGKSYLPLAADAFLVDYLKQVDESLFKTAVWPILRKEVAQGPAQSLLMYHVLLVCEERFPSIVASKFVKQILGTPQILDAATMPTLLIALKGDFKLTSISHPVYLDVMKYLANTTEETLVAFWQEVEKQLLVDSTVNANRQVLALQFFSLIVQQLQNVSQVLSLLTPNLLSWFMKKHKVPGASQKLLNKSCKEGLESIFKLCVKASDSKSLISVIKKMLFDPGNILFEQLSGSNIIQQLMGHLKEKSVMKLAVMLKAVITGSSSAVDRKDAESTSRPWYNKEKLYTVHLFIKLLSLPCVQAEMDWRLEQLTFLFDMGFFPTSNVGAELAGHVRESFFSCLNHKLPNLVDLRNIMAGLVEHINKRFDSGDQLRIKVTSEVMPAWEKMYKTAKQIGEEKKSKQEQWVISVFQTIFYHIGLHLFREAAFATDVLQELHSVYERIGSSVSIEEEPHWTEVVVEMFLSLLSRNSQLHRTLIGRIFSHFCPHMIPQNIHQILQVLDPNSNTNPLLNTIDNGSESSSEDGSADEGGEEEEDDKESSDDGMTDIEEEDGDEDEKVNDKLKRAVIEALGDTGAMTDVESVDLDEMGEEEGARVDKALSQAFQAMKPKKQPSHAKALTHFRLRVLDLIELWLSSEPPLDLMVDTLLRLLSLLEHSLVDKYQAPLEIRVRAVIKKLTATKKYDVSDCKGLHLGQILKSLYDKNDRTTPVYMSISNELTACTQFIVKASQQFEASEADEEEHVTVFSVLNDIVQSFFLQRDCLLTADLFNNVFSLNVPYICKLASKLPSFVFDPNVHPYRRSKALDFLVIFWKNKRLQQQASDDFSDHLKKMSKRLYKGSLKMMEENTGRIQPKFIHLLRNAFECIQKNKWIPDVDWAQHFTLLSDFQKTHVTKPGASKEKILNGHGNKTPVEENMEGDESDGDNAESPNESESDGEGVVAIKNPDQDVTNSLLKDDLTSNVVVNEQENGISSEEEESQQESEERSSESEEPPKKKPKKTSDKKKSREKIKRTQLLKNNSKKMRLESMAAGLEENVFTKYNMLLQKAGPSSPER